MRNIVVTGASSGIGRELVKYYVSGGHRILAIARRTDLLEELKAEAEKAGEPGKIISFGFDLERPEKTRDELLDRIRREFTYVDILVNNAGYLSNTGFGESSEDMINRTMAVNFTAPFLLIQGLMSLLLKSRHAHVVNISSMGGVQGTQKFPGLAAYSASKGAIAILTESLAAEYHGQNISFNCIAPGAVQTEMFGLAFPGHKANVQPQEMAEFIAKFSLEQAGNSNGKIIQADL